MSMNSPIKISSESLTASLPMLQKHLQKFLAEYEDKVTQARAQLAHVEALLGSLPTEDEEPKAKGVSLYDSRKQASQKVLKTKRLSLFGSDKDKIIIGKKFDEPLTEFQDYI